MNTIINMSTVEAKKHFLKSRTFPETLPEFQKLFLALCTIHQTFTLFAFFLSFIISQKPFQLKVRDLPFQSNKISVRIMEIFLSQKY